MLLVFCFKSGSFVLSSWLLYHMSQVKLLEIVIGCLSFPNFLTTDSTCSTMLLSKGKHAWDFYLRIFLPKKPPGLLIHTLQRVYLGINTRGWRSLGKNGRELPPRNLGNNLLLHIVVKRKASPFPNRLGPETLFA